MTLRGIEIGHIFYFGEKYSAAMGPRCPALMASGAEYGFLWHWRVAPVGGIIEASHDDKGITWPETVPSALLVNLKPGDAGDAAACDLYEKLITAGLDPLLDDRDERPGAKLASMDLIGIPWQIVVGPRGMENGVVEVKHRKSGETVEISPESALSKVLG